MERFSIYAPAFDCRLDLLRGDELAAALRVMHFHGRPNYNDRPWINGSPAPFRRLRWILGQVSLDAVAGALTCARVPFVRRMVNMRGTMPVCSSLVIRCPVETSLAGMFG